ncbi:MAG: hypothetical protein V4553_13240 [Bacteroidota bacterium]
MKNLNRTIQKAIMPKPIPATSVNRKFIYSLCAALFLLTCSLSTKAQDGTQSDPDTLTFGHNYTTYQNHKNTSACTSCSPVINDYGDAIHSGPNRWIKITLIDDGYLTILGGTSDFDSVFYLFDCSKSLITSGDDGEGSGDNNSHYFLQPSIQYYASAGTYYLVVDATDKYITSTSDWQNMYGTVGYDVSFTY